LKDNEGGKNNPFWFATYDDVTCYTFNAADRCAKVKRFTREQCDAALALDPPVQETVRQAVDIRLRKLAKEGR